MVWTAIALAPSWIEFSRGLLVPTIPRGGASWTVALMGGIGGTVTVLCYGYWIREEGRQSVGDLTACRIDLACAYVMTAIFGLAMVTIGSSLGPMEGGGATLMVKIAGQLEQALGGVGPFARWAFLVGAWAAIFTSLLGVWQSTPYLFADLCQQMRGKTATRLPVDTGSLAYRVYLYAIALVPIVGLVAVEFREMQKVYAVVGALFIPMLAITLLLLNGQPRWVGEKYRNSRVTAVVLVGALLFFLVAGAIEVRDTLFPSSP
jgi:Mn2+/Fe2+ NRAMP family transporter